MKERIESLLRILKVEYTLMWILVIVTVIMYEADVLPQGTMVGNSTAEYVAQLTGVLLTICFIPMSLRMFGLFISRYVKTLALDRALKSYRRWSEIRIIMLFATVLFNISLYYWTMDITGLLCGGMGVIAALFCIPGKERMMSELDMGNNQEQENQ